MSMENPRQVPLRKTADGRAIDITEQTTWLSKEYDDEPQAIILAITPVPQPGTTAQVVAYVPVVWGEADAYYSTLDRALGRVQHLLGCSVAVQYQVPAYANWFPATKEEWETT